MVQLRRNRKARWRAEVSDETGKKRIRCFEKKEDALEYEAHMRRTRQRVRAGLERPQTRTLFLDFASDWLKRRRATNPASTADAEESKLRRIWLPVLGARLMASIAPSEILEILNRLLVSGIDWKEDDGTKVKGRAVSAATRNRHLALVRTIYEDAIRLGIVGRNPAAEIELLPERRGNTANVWRSTAHVETYVQRMYKVGELYGALATLLCFNGPRVGSALALEWSDIDWHGGVYHVTKTFEIISGQVHDRTKGLGEAGHEIYPLMPRTAAALERWRRFCPAVRSNIVFLDPKTNERLSYWSFENLHAKVVKDAGLPRITIHGLRHTCATLAEQAGLTKSEVQKLLGHSSIQTTERYTHMDAVHVGKIAAEKKFGATDGWVRPEGTEIHESAEAAG